LKLKHLKLERFYIGSIKNRLEPPTAATVELAKDKPSAMTGGD
jgi:hypothetical protein